MATLDSLKLALRHKVKATAPAKDHHPLSDEEYSAGLEILTQDLGWASYEDFVIPTLSDVLAPLFDSRVRVSVLEIGPGPKTVLGYLPERMRRKIKEYTALEPSALFATRLEEWLCPNASQAAPPLPCLDTPPAIRRIPFVAQPEHPAGGGDAKFDVILFCHSIWVWWCDSLDLDGGLVCQKTASFPAGVVRVADEDELLDRFAAFIAGFAAPDAATWAEWRNVWRALGRPYREAAAHQAHLLFGAPTVMAAFTRHATTALPELAAEVPLLNLNGNRQGRVKDREARLRRPAAIASPKEIRHVQACVRWALRYGVGLSVIGGGHSGNCLWRNVVGVDMGAFDQMHILLAGEDSNDGPLMVAGAGCKTGDIIQNAWKDPDLRLGRLGSAIEALVWL
ncbi:hypothetical protein C8A03DRAFT_34026 [Achaetomium macrosporum]|uniref:Uncharacterized protein n=1 Tax=Achaetomium macrosporum TaxID=79813 RepID=A0AAN7CAI3_9PEZI|nr:hypothetical protein C8A03DRAFT_34026 [Achaetomium macrosporum]